MKHTIFATLCITLLLQACKKNGGAGGSGSNNNAIMYPATLSFYEGNNGNYPSVSTFRYDSKHQLTYMGTSGRSWDVTAEQVIGSFAGSSSDTTIQVCSFDGDIYTGKDVSLVRFNYINKSSSGSITTPVNTYYFGIDQSNYRVGYYNGGTYTQSFTYDNNGNLTYSQFVTNAVGSPNSTNYDPGGLVYDRLTFKGYDDKSSPYSAVPGYRFAAYPWAYPQQMYFALSRHNPTQIIEESADPNTLKWFVYSQTDLTYIYNDQGYPSQVHINVTYPNSGTPNQVFSSTYNFTYSN